MLKQYVAYNVRA